MVSLPLLSHAALDNAVFELIVRELGVATAMRYIARHTHPDSIDYTADRHKWLNQNSAEIEQLLAQSDPVFDRLVAESKQKKVPSRNKTGKKRK